MKRIAALSCVLGFVILALAGCSSGPSSNDLAIQYMEEKYGESFTYASAWGNSLYGNHELLVSCDSLPELVLVEIEDYRSEDRVFRDNYLAVKYADQTQQFIQDSANAVFGYAKVHYHVTRTGLSETLPTNVSFEEYLADQRAELLPLIEVPQSNFSSREQLFQMLDTLTKYGTLYYGQVVIVEDDNFGKFSEDELETQMTTGEILGFNFKNLPNGTGIREWTEDGVIEITRSEEPALIE